MIKDFGEVHHPEQPECECGEYLTPDIALYIYYCTTCDKEEFEKLCQLSKEIHGNTHNVD